MLHICVLMCYVIVMKYVFVAPYFVACEEIFDITNTEWFQMSDLYTHIYYFSSLMRNLYYS